MTNKMSSPGKTGPFSEQADWHLTESLNVRHEFQRGARAGTPGK